MHTAELISLKKDEILDNWMKTLIEKIPEVKNHDKTAIQNSVPDLIEAIFIPGRSTHPSKSPNNHSTQYLCL